MPTHRDRLAARPDHRRRLRHPERLDQDPHGLRRGVQVLRLLLDRDKFRNPQRFKAAGQVTTARLRDSLGFDGRPIMFDHRALLDACPFLRRK